MLKSVLQGEREGMHIDILLIIGIHKELISSKYKVFIPKKRKTRERTLMMNHLYIL